MFDPCMVSLSNHRSLLVNVSRQYASSHRSFARLASEIFLSRLQLLTFDLELKLWNC